jgi:hypothetical protein
MDGAVLGDDQAELAGDAIPRDGVGSKIGVEPLQRRGADLAPVKESSNRQAQVVFVLAIGVFVCGEQLVVQVDAATRRGEAARHAEALARQCGVQSIAPCLESRRIRVAQQEERAHRRQGVDMSRTGRVQPFVRHLLFLCGLAHGWRR